MKKHERIQLRKQEIGTKRDRRLEKHSDNFNRMFSFFYAIIRKEICNFCGSDVSRDYEIVFDNDGMSAKMAFKKYENGEFPDYIIRTKHPNILSYVIKGKRGWGLWRTEWSAGIAEGLFIKYEILTQFNELSIVIPNPFMIELDNLIFEKRCDLQKDNFSVYLLDKEFKKNLYNNYAKKTQTNH